MTNKFAQALKRPQPDQATVTAFLAGADARSTALAAPATVQQPAEELRQLNVRVTKVRWMRLKKYCMHHDLEMQAVVATLIDSLAE